MVPVFGEIVPLILEKREVAHPSREMVVDFILAKMEVSASLSDAEIQYGGIAWSHFFELAMGLKQKWASSKIREAQRKKNEVLLEKLKRLLPAGPYCWAAPRLEHFGGVQSYVAELADVLTALLKCPATPSLSRWWSVESACGGFFLLSALRGSLELLVPGNVDIKWWPGETDLSPDGVCEVGESGGPAAMDFEGIQQKTQQRQTRLAKTKIFLRSELFFRSVIRGSFCTLWIRNLPFFGDEYATVDFLAAAVSNMEDFVDGVAGNAPMAVVSHLKRTMCWGDSYASTVFAKECYAPACRSLVDFVAKSDAYSRFYGRPPSPLPPALSIPLLSDTFPSPPPFISVGFLSAACILRSLVLRSWRTLLFPVAV